MKQVEYQCFRNCSGISAFPLMLTLKRRNRRPGGVMVTSKVVACGRPAAAINVIRMDIRRSPPKLCGADACTMWHNYLHKIPLYCSSRPMSSHVRSETGRVSLTQGVVADLKRDICSCHWPVEPVKGLRPMR